MYSTIKKWARENRETAVLCGLLIIAFFAYSFFYFSVSSEAASASMPLKFNSPDETANYFFAKNYSEDGILRIFEPLNFIAENRIQPRSMTVVGGYLVPGSFLGLILIYGWLAKIFGLKIIFYLTPLFACLAVFCFYEIIRKIFSRQIAFWSAALLIIHPAFWYYSARGLFPNILFVSLLIFSFYFLMRANIADDDARSKMTNYGNFILAGLFLGLAMTVRLSEIIWVGAVFLALFAIYKKNLRWAQVALFLIFALITFSPIFAYNHVFYGNSLLTAYNLGEEGAAGAGAAGVGWLVSFGRYVFPFGFHLKNIFKNFANYFMGMFWWLAVPVVISISIFAKKFINGGLDKKIKIYFLFSIFISLFLFCYYGSWLFYDNPAKEISVGTSYVRYWLPIYILTLPLVVYVFAGLIGRFRGGQKKVAAVVLSVVCFFLSVNLVFFDQNDGLAEVKKNVREYAVIADEVGRMIESNAVIVVDHADKIFFPEHKVIQPLRDEGTYKLIPRLASEMPLYYYGVTLPEKDIEYLYEKKFDTQKIEIIKVKDFGVESLYKFAAVE